MCKVNLLTTCTVGRQTLAFDGMLRREHEYRILCSSSQRMRPGGFRRCTPKLLQNVSIQGDNSRRLHKLRASLVSVPILILDVCTRFPSQPSTPHNILRGSHTTSGATACAFSMNGSEIYSNRKRQICVHITLEAQYHTDGTRCSPNPRPCILNTSAVMSRVMTLLV